MSPGAVQILGVLNPGVAGVERAAQASGSAVCFVRVGQARFLGLSPTSTRRTMP